jgi:hypothetical protein
MAQRNGLLARLPNSVTAWWFNGSSAQQRLDVTMV